MGFGMWLPHADGKSVIGLFYDSFVANELRSKWKMENGKWKMQNVRDNQLANQRPIAYSH
jgi:hypothetical protein